jgi:hypothetical protein
LSVKKRDEKILVKLANQARVALTRILTRPAFIIRAPDGRSRLVITPREVAMLVNNLSRRAIRYEREQQEGQHARQRRMSAARYC